MAKDVRPFLRWAGSKRKQVHLLSQFWSDEFTRYVEPFMGSACLFFAVKPEKALLADINRDLVRTFNAVRSHPRAVANRLARLVPTKQNYYNIREVSLSQLDEIDAAAKFIFLNRNAFNGLYRTNTVGKFNVPFAASGTGQAPTFEDLRNAASLLKGAIVMQADYRETLAQTERGDFVFVDPPYAVENRRIFTQYGPSTFGQKDLAQLGQELRAMDHRGVMFVVSYAMSREAMQNFGCWQSRRVIVQRNIAGFGAKRRRAVEVLFSNCFPTKFST